MSPNKVPKFVKKYLNLHDELLQAAKEYRGDVLSGAFPAAENAYDS